MWLVYSEGVDGPGAAVGRQKGRSQYNEAGQGEGLAGLHWPKSATLPPPAQLTLKAGDSMTVPFPPMLPSLRNRGFRRKKGGVVVLGPGLMARVTLVTFET